MNPAVNEMLGKARRAIDAARALLDRDDLDFAAARTYYAMFYIATALLGDKGVFATKHGALHSAYGLHFAKKRRLGPQVPSLVIGCFRQTHRG